MPRPTANGEIWVFNRSYTQYIPLSIYDLQTWLGSPSIYVWDCNNAGIIVESFKNFAEQHEREYVEQMRSGAEAGGVTPGSPPSLRTCIQLAACSKDQLLPMTPDLPADLFTTCLTTPIKMALRWFVMRNDLGHHLAPEVTLDQLEKIPGQFGDRRTMLGELNWIFTAITDTIAWNTLPRDTFQKLFRQDLLVASLFRNFLLAERIMKANDCCPLSWPKLPDTHLHPIWSAWDLALDICLSQLKGILEEDKTYVPSSFFEEQLTAFEVWLSQGDEERSPPEQLPIVLQVLLSQAHRLRALDLLGRFLDLGAWAVNLALSVGIFPYVLKLLQSSARELRSLLVFIWAKILAVDPSCQNDLVRDQSHKYFLTVVQDPAMLVQHKTWAVFVLASLVHNYKQGQDEAVSGHLVSICLNELEDSDPVYRQWLVLCLATCWDRHEEARGHATRDNAPDKLESLLGDQTPEVKFSVKSLIVITSLMSTGQSCCRLRPGNFHELLQRQAGAGEQPRPKHRHEADPEQPGGRLLPGEEGAGGGPAVRHHQLPVQLCRSDESHCRGGGGQQQHLDGGREPDQHLQDQQRGEDARQEGGGECDEPQPAQRPPETQEVSGGSQPGRLRLAGRPRLLWLLQCRPDLLLQTFLPAGAGSHHVPGERPGPPGVQHGQDGAGEPPEPGGQRREGEEGQLGGAE